jgi:uncharacterized membrane protein YkvA (DUF1232 family)
MPDHTPDELSTAVAEDLQSFDVATAEHNAAAAFESSGSRSPSKGLLSFYDRLREKIIKAVEKRGGRMTEGALRALLLVPDIFILLARLALDKNVPKPTRALIGGTLAYFILPFDLFPEGLLGGVGFMDDLVLATAVLAQSFSGDLEPYARKHWSGSEDLRVVIRDITETAHSLLGENLFEKVKRLLHRRGIQVESAPARRVDDDFE